MITLERFSKIMSHIPTFLLATALVLRSFLIFFLIGGINQVLAEEDQTAQPASVMSSEQQAQQVIDLFDSDKDGRLNKDEYAHGTVKVFHSMDHNANITLDAHEVHDPADSEVNKADQNHDSKLSFTEVLEHQKKAFDVKDTDDDGYLSKGEIEGSIKDKSGGK